MACRIAILAAVVSCALAAEPLETILTRMNQSAKLTNSFSADVTRTEYTAILDQSDNFSGVMRLRKSGSNTVGVVEFTKPDPNTVIFTGKTFEKYFPKANTLEVYELGKTSKVIDRYLLLTFGVSGTDLRKDFEISAGGEETLGGVRTTKLDLVPKDKEAGKLVARIEMWIPEGQTYAIQQKVTEPNKDYELWRYSNVKINPPLPQSAFEFKPPANVNRKVLKP